MEACAGAHRWARGIAKLGHHARLIAPAYVKPFIKRQKNDAADAEAICEYALRSGQDRRAVGETASCSEPAISWCVSAPSASTLFAGTCWNTAISFPRASPMLKPLSPWSRIYSPLTPYSARIILKLHVDNQTFAGLVDYLTVSL
jgi:hypothetical protein